jgi:hypothetical protein
MVSHQDDFFFSVQVENEQQQFQPRRTLEVAPRICGG